MAETDAFFFVYFVVQTLLGLHSCPLVSIRGSPSSPSFVFFRVFRAFRGSNTAWTTFLSIRVHSCPFVVLPLPSSSCFSCFSCFSWFKHCLDYVFCIFVSIRVHSWFPLFTLLRVFRGSNTVCAACNESIRGQDEQCLFCGQVMLCLVWDDISGDEAPAFEDFDMVRLNPVHEIV